MAQVYPTVEPTYQLILMVVKTMLEYDASPASIRAVIETMESTIIEADNQRKEVETVLGRLKYNNLNAQS